MHHPPSRLLHQIKFSCVQEWGETEDVGADKLFTPSKVAQNSFREGTHCIPDSLGGKGRGHILPKIAHVSSRASTRDTMHNAGLKFERMPDIWNCVWECIWRLCFKIYSTRSTFVCLCCAHLSSPCFPLSPLATSLDKLYSITASSSSSSSFFFFPGRSQWNCSAQQNKEKGGRKGTESAQYKTWNIVFVKRY